MRSDDGTLGPDDPDVGPDLELDELIAPIYSTVVQDLRGVRSALVAESAAGTLLGMVSLITRAGVPEAEQEDAFAALVIHLVDYARRQATPSALALLRALSAVAAPPIHGPARAAAELLAEAGVRDRAWASVIGAPTPVRCWRYGAPEASQEVVTVTFAYRRKEHAVTVLIDHRLGGGVKDCWLSEDPDALWEQTSSVMAQDPRTEFGPIPWDRAQDVLQAALAAPPCPEDEDQVEDVATFLPILRSRLELLDPPGSARPDAARPAGATSGKALRRKASPAGGSRTAAGVLRLRVDLEWAKPPIWRRVEVPACATLGQLHEVLQAAFGWDGSHLHSFDDGDQSYGRADLDLDFVDQDGVRLTEVTPVGGTLKYTYDFGDSWKHVVRVEKRVPAEEGVVYPRCTGGRRAAPPDDCGGVGGYEDLLEAIADPGHEDHQQMTEWFAEVWGMDVHEVASFDPALFDVVEIADINEALASLTGRPGADPGDPPRLW